MVQCMMINGPSENVAQSDHHGLLARQGTEGALGGPTLIPRWSAGVALVPLSGSVGVAPDQSGRLVAL